MSAVTDAVFVTTVTETISVVQVATGVAQDYGEISQRNMGFTFTHGLLIGQLSVVIILFMFIRFFIFANGSHLSDPNGSPDHGKDQRQRKKQSSILRQSPPMPARSILARTYYNVDTHPPESLDWLNVLVAQSIAQLREDARSNNNILRSLDKILNGDSLPSFLDTVHVTELDIGEEFPIFSNCTINPCEDDPGRLEARFDVDLADSITLGIDTRLLLNYPTPLLAILPVSLSVSIVRFSGQLTLSFKTTPPTTTSDRKTSLTFSFSPEYRLEFSIKSLLSHASVDGLLSGAFSQGSRKYLCRLYGRAVGPQGRLLVTGRADTCSYYVLPEATASVVCNLHSEKSNTFFGLPEQNRFTVLPLARCYLK